jgi:tape measure domain-containing protein
MSGIVIEVDANTRKAQRNLEEVNTAVKSISHSVNAMTDGFKSAFVAIGSTFAADQLLRYVEDTTSSLQEMENKVALIVGKSNELYDTQVRLRNIADETKGTYSETVEVFTAMGRAMRGTNVDIERLLRSSKTIQQAVAISGSSAESSKAALVQLGQGFSSGTLRGEELNSVMEQTPRIAAMIADSMGVTLGQMRLIAAQGEVTSEVIFKALADQAERINKEFTNIVPTLSKSLIKMKENAAYAFAEFDKGLELSDKLSKNIFGVSEALGASIDKAYLLGYALKVALKSYNTPLKDLLEPITEFLDISIYMFRHALDTIGFTRFVTSVIEPMQTKFVAFVDVAMTKWKMFGSLLRSNKGNDSFYIIKPLKEIGNITFLTMRNSLITVEAQLTSVVQGVTGRFRAFIIKEMRSFNIGGEIAWFKISKSIIENLQESFLGINSVGAILKATTSALFVELGSSLGGLLQDLGDSLAQYDLFERIFGITTATSKLAKITGNLINTATKFGSDFFSAVIDTSETFVDELYYTLAEGLNTVLPKFAKIDMPIAFKLDALITSAEESLDGLLNSFVTFSERLAKLDLFGMLVKGLSELGVIAVDVFNVLIHWVTTFTNLVVKSDIGAWFVRAIDGIGFYADKLRNILAPIQAFGDAVIEVFFKVYDAVIGHSWWTDTVETIIYTSANLWGNTKKGLGDFGNSVIDLFENIYDKIGNILTKVAKLDFSKTMGKLNAKLYAYSPDLAGYAVSIEDSIGKAVTFLQVAFTNTKLFDGLRYSFAASMGAGFTFLEQRFRAWIATWPIALRQAFSVAAMVMVFKSLPKVIAEGVMGGWLLASAIISSTSLAITLTANTFDKSLGVELGKMAGDLAAGVVNGSVVDIPRLIGEAFAFIGNFMQNFLTGIPYVGVLFAGIFKIASLFGSGPAVGVLGAWLFGGTAVRLLSELGIYRKTMGDIVTRQRSFQSFFSGTYTGSKSGGPPTPLGKISQAFFNDTNRTQSLAIMGLGMDVSGMFNSLYKDNVIGHAIARGGLIWLALTGESGLQSMKTNILAPIMANLYSVLDRSPMWWKIKDKWNREVTSSAAGGFVGLTQWMAREAGTLATFVHDRLAMAFSNSNKIGGATFMQHLLLGRGANSFDIVDRFILQVESAMVRMKERIGRISGVGGILGWLIPSQKTVFMMLAGLALALSAMATQAAETNFDNKFVKVSKGGDKEQMAKDGNLNQYGKYTNDIKGITEEWNLAATIGNPLQAIKDAWDTINVTATQWLLGITAGATVFLIVAKELKRTLTATYAEVDRAGLVMTAISYLVKSTFRIITSTIVEALRLLYFETVSFKREKLTGLAYATAMIQSALAVIVRFIAAIYIPQAFGLGGMGMGIGALAAWAAYSSGPAVALRMAANKKLEAALLMRDTLLMKLDNKFANLAYLNARVPTSTGVLRSVDILLQTAAAAGAMVSGRLRSLPAGMLKESIAEGRGAHIAQYVASTSYAGAAQQVAMGISASKQALINKLDTAKMFNRTGVQESLAVFTMLEDKFIRFASTLKAIRSVLDSGMSILGAAATYRAMSSMMALYIVGNLVNAFANPKKRGEQEGFLGSGHAIGMDYFGNMPFFGGEVPLSHLLIPGAMGIWMLKSAKRVGLARAHDVSFAKQTARYEKTYASQIAADASALNQYKAQQAIYESTVAANPAASMVPPIVPTATAPARPVKKSQIELEARDAKKRAFMEWQKNSEDRAWMARQESKLFQKQGLGTAAEYLAMTTMQQRDTGVRATRQGFMQGRYDERMAAGRGSVIRHTMPAVAGAGVAGLGMMAVGGYLGAKAGSSMSDGSQEGISLGAVIGAGLAGWIGKDVVTSLFNVLKNTKNLALFKWTWIPVAMAMAWDSISTAHKTIWDRIIGLWDSFKNMIGLKEEPKDLKTGLGQSNMVEAAKLGISPSFDISKIDMEKLSYSESTILKDTLKKADEALNAAHAERLRLGYVTDETASAANESLKALARMSKEFAAKTKINVEETANQMLLLSRKNDLDPTRGTQAKDFIGGNWKELLGAVAMTVLGSKLKLLAPLGAELAPAAAGTSNAARYGRYISDKGGNIVRVAASFIGLKGMQEDMSTAIASGAVEGLSVGLMVPGPYKAVSGAIGLAVGAGIGAATSAFSSRKEDYQRRDFVEFPSSQGYVPSIPTTYNPMESQRPDYLTVATSDAERARLEAENLRKSFINSIKESTSAYNQMDKGSGLAAEYSDRLAELNKTYHGFKATQYEIGDSGAINNKELNAKYYRKLKENVEALQEWTDASIKQTEFLRKVSAREAIAKNEPGFWKPLGVTLDNLKDFQLSGPQFAVGQDVKKRADTLVHQTQFSDNADSNANLFEKKRLADKRIYLQTLEADKYLNSGMALTKLGNDISLALGDEVKYLSEDITNNLRERIRKIQFVEEQALTRIQLPSLENLDAMPLADRSAAKIRNQVLMDKYNSDVERADARKKALPGFRFGTRYAALDAVTKTPEAMSAKMTNLYAADATKALANYRELGLEQTNDLMLTKERLSVIRDYAVSEHKLDLLVDVDKLISSVDKALTPLQLTVSAALENAFAGLSDQAVTFLPADTFIELKSIGTQIARIKKDLDDPESQFLPQEDLIAKKNALKDLKARAEDLVAVLQTATGDTMLAAVSDLGLSVTQRASVSLSQMKAALALKNGIASVAGQLANTTDPTEQQRLIQKAAGYENTRDLLKFTATLDKSGFNTVAEALGLDLNKLSNKGKSLLKEFSGLAKYINILKADSVQLNSQAAIDKYLSNLTALARLTERVQMTNKQNTLEILGDLAGGKTSVNLAEQLSLGVVNGLSNTSKVLKQKLSEAIADSGDVLDGVALKIAKGIDALSSYQPLIAFFDSLADKAETAIHGGIGRALEQVNKAFPDLKIDATVMGKMDAGARKSLTDKAYNVNILRELQTKPLNEDQAKVLNRLGELGPEKTIEEFAKVGKSLLESIGITDIQLNTVALDGVQNALKFNTDAINANTSSLGGKPPPASENTGIVTPKSEFKNTGTQYDEMFKKYGEMNNVPPALLKAIATNETANFDTKAVSSAGAVGIMQLMKATGDRFGVTDRTNAEQSIAGAGKYLRYLMDKFPTLEEVSAAYNAGEGSVERANAKAKANGGSFKDYLPRPKETVPYTGRVMADYANFSKPVEPPKITEKYIEYGDKIGSQLNKFFSYKPPANEVPFGFSTNLENFIPKKSDIELPDAQMAYEDFKPFKVTLSKPNKPTTTVNGGTDLDTNMNGINITARDKRDDIYKSLDSFDRMFGDFGTADLADTMDKIREGLKATGEGNPAYDAQHIAEKIADQIGVNTNLPDLKLGALPDTSIKTVGSQVDLKPFTNALEVYGNSVPTEAPTVMDTFRGSNKPLAGQYGDALGLDPKALQTLSAGQFSALDTMTAARANVQQQLTEGLGTKGYDASAATQALKNLDDQINSFVEGVNANVAELKVDKAGAYMAANKNNITGFLGKFSSIGTEVTGMMNEADKATAKSMAIQKLYLEDKLAKDSIAGKSTQETSKQLADLADAEGYLKDKTLEAANAVREAGKAFADSITSTFKDAFKGLLNRESDKGKSVFKTFTDKLVKGIKDQTVDIFTNAVTDSIGLGKGGLFTKMLSRTGAGLSSGFRALGGGVQSLLSGKGSWSGFTSGVSSWFSDLTANLDNATPEEIQMAAATKFSDAVDRFAGGGAISGAANAATGSGIGGALMSAMPWVGGAAGVAGLGYMATKGGDWSSGLKDLGANFTTKAGSALTPSGNPMETLDPRTGLFGKMDPFDADVTGLFNNKSSSNKNGWSAGLSDSLAKSTPDTTGLWDIIMKPIKWFFSLIGDGFTGIMSFFTGAGQGVGTSSGKPESATSPLDSFKLKFANGGPVSGGGTTTSDSIPAMLSDGEFVINAKSTRENREMLERINRGEVVKRSLGGIVSMGTSLAGRAIGGKTGTALSSLGSIASGVAGMLSSQQAEQAAESLLAASQHLETAATALENFAATGSMGGGAGGFGGLNGSTIGLNGIPEGMTNFSRQTGMEGATTQGIADTSGYGATPGLTPISSVGMGDLSASGGMVGGGLFDGIGKFFEDFDFGKIFGSLGNLFGLGAATGGHIVGPGSGTSDSIPANLSNGEFVVNAAATKGNLGLLHSINAGKKVQHRALGGLLTMIPGLVGGIGGMIKGGGGGGAGGIMGMISQLLGPLMKLFGGGAGGGGIMSLFGGTKAATGGKIVGPGSGTSDSIPAMISNGEFVVNAAATKANLGLLHSLNSGRQHFAEGGLAGVSSGIMTTPTSKGFKPISVDKSTKSTQQVVNLNITGDISRQTKSEIFKMMPTIASGVNLQNKEAGIKR